MSLLRTPPARAQVAQLRAFLHMCAGSAACEQGDRLREGARLFGLPRDAQALRRFEAMIECGAFESAAMALVADGPGFILSRGSTGACLASAALADGSDELVAEGASLALALLQAHTSVLLAECDGPVPARSYARGAPAGARLH